jgi:hypothetical protein
MDKIGLGFVWHNSQEKIGDTKFRIVNLEGYVKSALESVAVK